MPTIPIKWLTDSNANKRYPVTHTKAVFDDNGDDLETILAGLGGSLSGLSDTSITNPSNGQILKYNTTSSKWENAAETTELPSITGNASKVLAVNSGATGVEWITPSGGSSLPSQTGNSGKFLTTDGTNASWGSIPSDIVFVNFTESSGTWSCDTSIDTILSYVSNGKMVYGICYLDDEARYGIIPLTMYTSDNSSKEADFEVQVFNYSYAIYGYKYYDDGNNSWGEDEWSYYGDPITNIDFTHTTNTTVSTATTTISFGTGRSSKMITISNDLGITFYVSNWSDNYLWIKNTGSSEVDIVINSVSYGSGGTPLSNVYMPSDGISVPAGCVCEIGIIINADGAFITSRNDLEL